VKLRPERLPADLKRELRPAYLISGDEPFQLGEAADAVRRRARELGFSDREVLEHGPVFDWQSLGGVADNLSLFADKRLIELRLSSSRIGVEGSRALCDYAERPPPDILLLITAPKLEAGQLTSKWVQALDRLGAVVQVWPLTGVSLEQWVEQRLASRGLRPVADVVPMLAERIEGNLPAAAQEIDKLRLLCGEGPIGPEQLLESVGDSARFDVFGLVDTLLQGEGVRGLRVLSGLRGEGVPAAIVLWALAREVRALASMAFAVEAGTSRERVLGAHRVWERRRPLVAKGLERLGADAWRGLLCTCAHIDRMIKGREAGDPWLAMADLALDMAGMGLFSDNLQRLS